MVKDKKRKQLERKQRKLEAKEKSQQRIAADSQGRVVLEKKSLAGH
jgi:hypothetical protein